MIPTPPLRSLFKSRWMALAWAGAICWMAVSFVGGDDRGATINAANASDSNSDQASALAAEDG